MGKTRRGALEELRHSELRSWSLDTEQLAKRLSTGERDYGQLEANLLGEISRLQNSDEAAAAAATSGNSQEADIFKAPEGADGSELAEMNASIRDIQGKLCEQQI